MEGQSQKKILVIDDELTNRRLIQSQLEKSGYLVVVAEDGLVGLEKLHSEKPDLIILDVEMPRMDGYAFMLEVEKLDDSLKHVPVIILTAHDDKQPIFSLRGVKDYLIKPISPDILLDKIQEQITVEEFNTDVPICVYEPNETQAKLLQHFINAEGFSNVVFEEGVENFLSAIKSGQHNIFVAGAGIDFDSLISLHDEMSTVENKKFHFIVVVDKNNNEVDISQLTHADKFIEKTANYDLLIAALKK